MTIDAYLGNDQHNLEQIRLLLPHFRDLMPQIHDLYESSRSLIPRDSSPILGRCLLICHKSFLSAAAAIGRRHPDDAAPVTRRAIETVTLALAFKLDPTNLERWQQADARLSRWAKRRQEIVPKQIHVRYTGALREHEGLNALKRIQGILSDGFVHFTPEFVVLQAFRDTTEGETTSIELPFLEVDQKVIEQQLLILADVHTRAISIFNECYDGWFSQNAEWKSKDKDVARLALALGEHYVKNRTQKRGYRN